MQPICNLCITYVHTSTYCPSCTPVARRHRQIRGTARVALLVAAIGGPALYAITRPPMFDYGIHASEVRAAEHRVASERCDREGTVQLEDALLTAGDYRRALRDVEAFEKACGDWYRVRWTAYTAHRHLSDNQAAVADATALIAANPTDKDYRWWRGIAYEEMGRLKDAAADYRESMRLRPDIGSVPFNLASVLERQGDLCGARAAIEQFVHYHAESASDEAVMGQLARLGNRAECAPPPTK